MHSIYDRVTGRYNRSWRRLLLLVAARRPNHPVDPVRVAAAKARLIDIEEASRLAGLLGLHADPDDRLEGARP